MARPATGTIVERRNRKGKTTRMLVLTINGRRRGVSLGTASREDAERELRGARADIERGIEPAILTRSRAPVVPETPDVPTFHDFADEWWALAQGQLAPKTKVDYLWRLERYLVPFFGAMRLGAIDVQSVERYKAKLLAENEQIRKDAAKGKPQTEKYTDKRGRECERRLKPLSPRAINMTLILLGAILESALERELVDRNPARGSRRRLRERRPQRSYLDSAAQIEALLDAASELDSGATKERRHIERRAMLAVLTFAGVRIDELCELRWRDVDLAAGWLTVGKAKTDAGVRKVKLRGALRDELARIKPDIPRADGYVFAARGGKRMSADNIRKRVLGGSVRLADEKLSAAGLPPLPDKITPHSLRRTFATVLYALGESPVTVMHEMGHTDPGLAMRIYAQAMRLSDDERTKLAALVEGGFSDSIVTNAPATVTKLGDRRAA